MLYAKVCVYIETVTLLSIDDGGGGGGVYIETVTLLSIDDVYL